MEEEEEEEEWERCHEKKTYKFKVIYIVVIEGIFVCIRGEEVRIGASEVELVESAMVVVVVVVEEEDLAIARTMNRRLLG